MVGAKEKGVDIASLHKKGGGLPDGLSLAKVPFLHKRCTSGNLSFFCLTGGRDFSRRQDKTLVQFNQQKKRGNINFAVATGGPTRILPMSNPQ